MGRQEVRPAGALGRRVAADPKLCVIISSKREQAPQVVSAGDL